MPVALSLWSERTGDLHSLSLVLSLSFFTSYLKLRFPRQNSPSSKHAQTASETALPAGFERALPRKGPPKTAAGGLSIPDKAPSVRRAACSAETLARAPLTMAMATAAPEPDTLMGDFHDDDPFAEGPQSQETSLKGGLGSTAHAEVSSSVPAVAGKAAAHPPLTPTPARPRTLPPHPCPRRRRPRRRRPRRRRSPR